MTIRSLFVVIAPLGPPAVPAAFPRQRLLDPVVISEPAPNPNASLLPPVEHTPKAFFPTTVQLAPVVNASAAA